MGFAYEVTSTLIGYYRIWGIGFMLYSIFSLCFHLRYQVPDGACSVYLCFTAAIPIFFIFGEGRQALKKKKATHLRLFSFMFLLGFWFSTIGQQPVISMMRENALNRTSSLARTEIIANFDQQPPQIQQFIQTNQQDHKCCGIFGWKDYEKEIQDLPVSCCSKFHQPATQLLPTMSPDRANLTRCYPEELEGVEGCKHQEKFVDLLMKQPGIWSLLKALIKLDRLLLTALWVVSVFQLPLPFSAQSLVESWREEKKLQKKTRVGHLSTETRV